MTTHVPDRVVPLVAPPRVMREDLGDGAFVLRSPEPLGAPDPTIGTWLARWARERPDDVVLAERDGDAWRCLTWARAWDDARAIGQALVDRGLSVDRPVVVLSGNSIDHARVLFGALLVGVPVVPVSVAYSLMSADHAQLRHIVDLVTPGLVFAEQGAPFGPALADLDVDGVEVVTSGRAPDGVPATALDALAATRVGASYADAVDAVGPDTVAKILMTSGSTGRPKGVVNTHRMLTANQQALAQAWPFVDTAPPTLVDWLPWSHTFGGNHNLDLVLRTGGTMYVDGGRPAPGMFDQTVRNLTEVAPTIQFNVPAGYAMLAAALEKDADLRATFFSRLQGIFYAAAALPQDTWARLDAVAERTLGHRIWLTTAWGATETSPLATSAHFPADRAGNIGLPVPGVELKFVPAGDKLELRVRGPNVTPGYHRDPERTAAAFDADGFYRIGDAGRLVDPNDPAAGVAFDGRVSEDFKLTTGTWVNVGHVRTEALSAAAGLLSHAVVTGHDREQVGLLAWLAPGAAAEVAEGDEEHAAALARDPGVHRILAEALARYNAHAHGSSRRVGRVLLLADPPSLDAGEITDKGYVNAGAVLRHRREAVERLHDRTPGPDVVVL